MTAHGGPAYDAEWADVIEAERPPQKVYISGPMTGYPALNEDAFAAAERALRAAGHEPLNPARHPLNPAWTWTDYLRLDLRDVLDADGVAVLPGWEVSRGAALEVHVAHALGMTVLPVEQWEARR